MSVLSHPQEVEPCNDAEVSYCTVALVGRELVDRNMLEGMERKGNFGFAGRVISSVALKLAFNGEVVFPLRINQRAWLSIQHDGLGDGAECHCDCLGTDLCAAV